ncbi:hypothetical protein [Nocardia flavorosea]|uniref:hypothetical protein n=1 Tax=Nocardia flavorosea TaxID=53429 RepID=UPI0024551929|nr:hypothetical protein [Nocardia flavorosea]
MDHVERDLPTWLERIQQPQSPATGSLLWNDDQVWPKWPVSQMAWQGLISATDHMDLLNDSLSHSGVRPVSQFTLVRAAQFAAARSIWILAPEQPELRQKHALWVAYEDFRYLLYDRQELIKSALGRNLSPEQQAALLAEPQGLVDEAKDIARTKLGFQLGGREGEKVTSDTDIVGYAATLIDSEDGRAAAGINHKWRVNSGYAHGLGWPELLKPAEVFQTEDGKKFRRIVGDDEALAQGIGAAWLLTQRAFHLYAERSSAPAS